MSEQCFVFRSSAMKAAQATVMKLRKRDRLARRFPATQADLEAAVAKANVQVTKCKPVFAEGAYRCVPWGAPEPAAKRGENKPAAPLRLDTFGAAVYAAIVEGYAAGVLVTRQSLAARFNQTPKRCSQEVSKLVASGRVRRAGKCHERAFVPVTSLINGEHAS